MWPKFREILLEWMGSGGNEVSLVSQRDASLRFDQRDQLPSVRVPMDVITFDEHVGGPLAPGAELHLIEGMGHGSWYGHTHTELNGYDAGKLKRYYKPATGARPVRLQS